MDVKPTLSQTWTVEEPRSAICVQCVDVHVSCSSHFEINTDCFRNMGVPAEGRRGVLLWSVLCVLGSLLWLARDASGQQAFPAVSDAFVGCWSHRTPRSARDQSLRASLAPMSQPLQALASPRGNGLSPQIRKRLAALKREAILACLKAVNDDTEAVELCARLSRKLSYVKTIIRRQMEDAGVVLTAEW